MTAIEWTEQTWNPVTGCDRVSPGCDHCYALTMAKRLKAMGNPKYQNDGNPTTSGPGFAATFHQSALELPFTWRRPQRVFVNSMADLFHDRITDAEIAQVFAVMALAPQHTFQVLTKRHARMRSLLSQPFFPELVTTWAWRIASGPARALGRVVEMPLRNVWLGVSVENQQWADIRIPALVRTPAAVRFLSCEPLLGPVDLNAYMGWKDYWSADAEEPDIDWVIVGGESGPGARPMDPSWARLIRNQCRENGVPFLFKQWGEYRWISHRDGGYKRVGKKAAGRELDGRTWDEYPQAVTV